MSTTPDGGTRPRLSVAMVVCDAEQLAPATIESASQLADEIVVIDIGSQDATVDVCRQAGARVLDWKWDEDFSAARNYALEQIGGDWVLWLEAGETIDPRKAAELRAFIDEYADANVAYMPLVEMPPAADNVSGEQAAQIRLVARRPEVKFIGRVAETMQPALDAAGILSEPIDCTLYRDVLVHDPVRKAERAALDLFLAEREIGEGGQRPELYLAKAEALANLGRADAAAENYRQTIALADHGSTAMLEAYCGLLASFDNRQDANETQLALCLEALDIFPLDAQLLSGMGSYMLTQNRLDLAVRSYRIALEHGQVDITAWHLVDLPQVNAACLSLALQLLGMDDDAQEVLQSALEQLPNSERLRRQLINLHIKHGRSEEALADLDRLPEETPVREALRSAVRGGLLAAQKNWIAALPYLKAAYGAGCRDPLCLRWLVVTYLATGDLSATEPILREWQEQEPRNAEISIYLNAVAKLSDASSQEPQATSKAELQGPEAESEATRRIRVDAATPTQPSDRPVPDVSNPSLVGNQSGDGTPDSPAPA